MQQAHRSRILHFLRDPGGQPEEKAYEYFEDGLLVIQEGHVLKIGDAHELMPSLSTEIKVIKHNNTLLLPGFVDTHIHFPQVEIIAAYGEQLMDWLKKYAFPAEEKYCDRKYAKQMARIFIDQLLRNGTTTALVFCSVHPESVDAFFEQCGEKNLRMIAGKVMMDRNCPSSLRDTAETAYNDSKNLIDKWHNKGRLQYAVTPVLRLPQHLRNWPWRGS